MLEEDTVTVGPPGAAWLFSRWYRAMSPASVSKVSDAGARVQAPFTLSDTRTGSEASVWETHPTSKSPSVTGRVSVTVNVEVREVVENAAPWTKVGVVDWATAVLGSRAPRVAITAAPTGDRAARKNFKLIPFA